MKILVVEDDEKKSQEIISAISQTLQNSKFEVALASTVNDAIMYLGQGGFDVVIVDLVLPQIAGGEPVDATPQWCELIENHLSGRVASWIVMTAYSAIADGARVSFARHNVAVISFDETNAWRRNLEWKLKESREVLPLDFVVICALEKERRGFSWTEASLGQRENLNGLDCQHVTIGPLRGMLVTQPGPGMISAAIVTSKALWMFRPKAIAMSGICGGRATETSLGALIVPDVSWNYQSGKFKDGVFTADLLQVSVPPNVKTELELLSTEETSSEIRQGLMHAELANEPIQVVPMVSGSQVVADAGAAAAIGEQGRKVGGVDMEVASVFFAARHFYDGGGVFFAAKTVVDLANPDKDDRYHEYGCAISARYVVKALSGILCG